MWQAVTGDVSIWPALSVDVSIQPALTGDVSVWPALTGDVSVWPALAGNLSVWLALTGDVFVWPALTGAASFWPAAIGDVSVWPALTGDISFWSFVTFMVNNELNRPIEVTDILLSRMGYFSCIWGIVNKVGQPSCWCCVLWAFCPGWVVSISDSQLAFQVWIPLWTYLPVLTLLPPARWGFSFCYVPFGLFVSNELGGCL